MLEQQLQNKSYMIPLGWIKRSMGPERTLSSCMVMNPSVFRHTHGGERWSRELPVIYQANTDFGNI